MLPPDTVVRAATRWLRLLRASTLGQASSIIRADASYTDLTQTQYSSGLDWLRTLELVTEGLQGLALSAALRELPDEQISQLLFERILERSAPAWLLDADLLVPDAAELPQDASALAETLGLSDRVAFMSVRHVHGRVDLAERARVGLAGERALVELLERRWPGSTTHVAQTDDGFGYDVLFRHGNAHWHLEVKTTTRRGRLVVYLSRHEYDVSLLDPYWRLVVVGLDDQMRLQAVATVRHSELFDRAPRDVCADAKWQSASHQLTSRDLQQGFSFLNEPTIDPQITAAQVLSERSSHMPNVFAWMP
jgi:hypothetical protein